MKSARSAIGFGILLSCLLWDRQAVNAKVIADAGDDEMGPAAVNDGGEDEVRSEVPKLGLRRQRSKCCARNGEVWVVDKKSASNHGRKHDCPVREWLVSEMGQNNLSSHAPKDQRCRQAVQHQVVVLQQVRVRRAKPCDGADGEDDERRPLVDGWQERLVSRAASLCNVDQTCWHMRNEEREQDYGDP